MGRELGEENVEWCERRQVYGVNEVPPQSIDLSKLLIDDFLMQNTQVQSLTEDLK